MLWKNILPPSSGRQLVQADANMLQWSIPSNDPAQLAHCLPPHGSVNSSSSWRQSVTSKCQNKPAHYMVQIPKRWPYLNHNLHNKWHENPKTYNNKFTPTSDDVHSSKRPAIYISFGPFQPLSSLQSHDHVAGSSTRTCITTESSIWEDEDNKNMKTAATSLPSYKVGSTKLLHGAKSPLRSWQLLI
jgi:hypothetical protein